MVELDPDDRECVRAILREYVPDLEIWAFGSRVAGTSWRYSDLDLVLMTEKPLELPRLFRLKEAFEDSDLPLRVDVLDWSGISEEFRDVIRSCYEVLQTPSRAATTASKQS